jgi:hypothetical protein
MRALNGPPGFNSLTLRRKLWIVAQHGIEQSKTDPNYWETDDYDHDYFKIGPYGRPYSDASNACQTGNDANESYAEELGGLFKWHSKVYEEDIGRKYPRGWLYIRFEPTRIDNPQELVEAGSHAH